MSRWDIIYRWERLISYKDVKPGHLVEINFVTSLVDKHNHEPIRNAAILAPVSRRLTIVEQTDVLTQMDKGIHLDIVIREIEERYGKFVTRVQK